MLEGQGIFQLAARSAAYSAFARDTDAVHGRNRNVFERSEKPSGLASLTVDANTTIRAIFQQAWDKVHADGKLISDENIKRLEKASKSDNKEIAAERLRQAKAKLRSLRMQAQMAAASGDPKQLRRIAQQAAQAAREVASAARGLAEGIASSATADGSASGAVPNATTGAPKEATDTQSTPGTTQSDAIGSARDQLRELGDEARSAIAQARGLIAFAAQMARSRRHHRPDPDEDRDYRALQQSVTEAGRDLDSALNDAAHSLATGGDTGGVSSTDSISAIITTALVVQVTTELTVTANFTA